MLRDELLFQEASSASARNVLVGYVANRPTVVFRPTKVLPSACEYRWPAVHLATADTYTSTQKFHLTLANQFRWHLWKLETPFFRN